MTRISESAAIAELLQDDIRGEHAAIMQYLQHAYRLPEGELPAEIEEIAREEMRHFRWLCEMVVDLGGVPTITRDAIFLDAPSDVDLLRLDIDAEDRAIAQYRDHIERIDHPRVVRLLERILADELAHRQEFGGFVEDLGGEPAGTQAAGVGPWGGGPDDAELALEAPAETGPFGESAESEDVVPEPAADVEPLIAPNVRLIRQLNDRLREQYATILRQVHLSFLTKNTDPALSKELLESHATWHMKHYGWLAERVGELGGVATNDHAPVHLAGSTKSRLAEELRLQEKQLAHIRALRDETEDEKTHFLLDRIVTHDTYAADELADLSVVHPSDETPPVVPPAGPGRLTIGSLLGQRQP